MEDITDDTVSKLAFKEIIKFAGELGAWGRYTSVEHVPTTSHSRQLLFKVPGERELEKGL